VHEETRKYGFARLYGTKRGVTDLWKELGLNSERENAGRTTGRFSGERRFFGMTVKR